MARLPRGLTPLAKNTEPKRARSGYFLWCDEVRQKADAEIEGKSMAVASKILAGRWKLLSAGEKEPFEARARVLKQAFDLKKKDAPTADRRHALPSGWRASRDVISGAIVYTSLSTKESRWTRPADSEAVKMLPAPPSARRLHEQAVVAEGEAKVDWKDLTAEQRAPYEAAAKAARAEHKTKSAQALLGGGDATAAA